MQERSAGLGELLVSHQELSEAIEAEVSDRDHPTARLPAGMDLLLDLLPALLDMRDVLSLFDSLLCRIARVAFVGAQVLPALGTLNDDLIEQPLRLADIIQWVF